MAKQAQNSSERRLLQGQKDIPGAKQRETGDPVVLKEITMNSG